MMISYHTRLELSREALPLLLSTYCVLSHIPWSACDRNATALVRSHEGLAPLLYQFTNDEVRVKRNLPSEVHGHSISHVTQPNEAICCWTVKVLPAVGYRVHLDGLRSFLQRWVESVEKPAAAKKVGCCVRGLAPTDVVMWLICPDVCANFFPAARELHVLEPPGDTARDSRYISNGLPSLAVRQTSAIVS